MITGLLFTLSHRGRPSTPLAKSEGRPFPRPVTNKQGDGVVRAAKTAGLVLALAGLTLLAIGHIGWSYGPDGFFLETAQVVASNFTGATS